MMTGAIWFNTYLFLLAVALSVGCKSTEERRRDKAITAFRLHLETNRGNTGSDAIIEIAGARVEFFAPGGQAAKQDVAA